MVVDSGKSFSPIMQHYRLFQKFESVLFYILFIYTALLLPANLIASRIINYDGLSLYFGVLSVILIMAGLISRHRLYLILAVVAAFLATQEKLSAAPILMGSIVALGYQSAQEHQASRKCIAVAANVFIALLVALAVGVATALVMARLGNQDKTISLVFSSVEPLSIGIMIFSFSTGTTASLLTSHVSYLPIVFVLLFATAFVLVLLQPMISRLSSSLYIQVA